jgi:nicotinate-nucleotide--dimethylbenzimidazole phosphoribosyltransferase
VVDGFISGAGALIATRIEPACRDYLFFSHLSRERGHQRMLEYFDARPILDLDMCLGEGTGAAIAMDIITAAVRLYNEMATFDSASVSKSG